MHTYNLPTLRFPITSYSVKCASSPLYKRQAITGKTSANVSVREVSLPRTALNSGGPFARKVLMLKPVAEGRLLGMRLHSAAVAIVASMPRSDASEKRGGRDRPCTANKRSSVEKPHDDENHSRFGMPCSVRFAVAPASRQGRERRRLTWRCQPRATFPGGSKGRPAMQVVA